MSVYKSRRKDAAAEYIQAARVLRIMTMRIVKRLPKSYHFVIGNKLLEMASDIYTSSIKANSIYMHAKMDKNDYDLRHRYTMKAFVTADALEAEISFLYVMIDDGNNFFANREDYTKKFKHWMEKAIETRNRLKVMLESDRKRFAGYSK